MIPQLLWRCPFCGADDALEQRRGWRRPAHVRCARCATALEVRRVIGGDYRLRVVGGSGAASGAERPLAEWYAIAKASLTPSPLPRGATALSLAPGEDAYLESREADLYLRADDANRGAAARPGAPAADPPGARVPRMRRGDTGRVTLTSERLAWRGQRVALDFWWTRVESVHTEVTWRLGLMDGRQPYKVRFHRESVLKWLTYIAAVAARAGERTGRRIAVSNY